MITISEKIIVEKTGNDTYQVTRDYSVDSNEKSTKAIKQVTKNLTVNDLKMYLEFYRNAQRVDILTGLENV